MTTNTTTLTERAILALAERRAAVNRTVEEINKKSRDEWLADAQAAVARLGWLADNDNEIAYDLSSHMIIIRDCPVALSLYHERLYPTPRCVACADYCVVDARAAPLEHLADLGDAIERAQVSPALCYQCGAARRERIWADWDVLFVKGADYVNQPCPDGWVWLPATRDLIHIAQARAIRVFVGASGTSFVTVAWGDDDGTEYSDAADVAAIRDWMRFDRRTS